MGRRFDLQAPTSITGITEQDVRFSIRVPGGAKSFIAFVNVLSAATSSGTLNIYTASDLSLDPNLGLFWKSVGSMTALATTGTTVITGTAPLGEYVRWNVSAYSSSSPVRFSIVIFAFDA